MTATERVKNLLTDKKIDYQLKQLAQSAHTAQQASEALNCQVAQIVKSLVFKSSDSQQAVLALVSGDKQANLKKLATIFGEKIIKADADFVKAQTGFTIGGVAPVGSTNKLPVYMDEAIFNHSVVFAAAGHPNLIIEIKPDDLASVSTALIKDITN